MPEYANTTPANGRNKKGKPMQKSKAFKRLPNTHTQKNKQNKSRFGVRVKGSRNLGLTEGVCVFFPSILDIKFVGRTSRGHTGGRSHRIFIPPSFCGACLDFCREKDSAIPFPRRP